MASGNTVFQLRKEIHIKENLFYMNLTLLENILEYNTETDKWVANSKVRAFPVTSCLICVVDTCGANEETLET